MLKVFFLGATLNHYIDRFKSGTPYIPYELNLNVVMLYDRNATTLYDR